MKRSKKVKKIRKQAGIFFKKADALRKKYNIGYGGLAFPVDDNGVVWKYGFSVKDGIETKD